MKSHTITDELLRELHSEADMPLREKIEKEVPGIVDPREVNKWYKSDCYLIQYLGNDRCVGFRFPEMEWQEGLNHIADIHSVYHPATDEEVKAALIGEAEKRGLVEGVKVILPERPFRTEDRNGVVGNEYIFHHYADYNETVILSGGYAIFSNGTWATIIEQPAQKTSQDVADAFIDYLDQFKNGFLKHLKNG